ncbi:MAG: RNA methyltransferase [Thermodesulfobacteriota bacterium]|nr:RNA methyltransferase [Thermodesulfobacteriota bacterium]
MCGEDLYIALLHYPVFNKKGDIVTTAVTNMDIHDISRAARTYGVKRFYIVTPIEQQQAFVKRILHHWQEGHGVHYNPSRKEAFDIVDIKGSLDDVIRNIAERVEKKVRLVVTSATRQGSSINFEDMRKGILSGNDAYLLAFGTGWGFSEEIIERADFVLEPIKGPSDYNHLSVRSAVAVVLDRLCGET